MTKGKIVIFGLSTQGYSLASQLAIKGEDVHIIDESAASAPNTRLLKSPTSTSLSMLLYLFKKISVYFGKMLPFFW